MKNTQTPQHPNAQMPTAATPTPEQLTQQAQEYLDGWKRARADYENLHKRSTEERAVARAAGREEALAAFLAILDHLDAALLHVPADLTTHPWVNGIRHVEKAATQTLASLGIVTVGAVG